MDNTNWIKGHEGWILSGITTVIASSAAMIRWIVGKNDQLNTNTERIEKLEKREEATPEAVRRLEKIEETHREHLGEGHPLCQFHAEKMDAMNESLSHQIEALHADLRTLIARGVK